MEGFWKAVMENLGYIIPAALFIIANLLNTASKYWTGSTGLKRWGGFLLEAVSVVRSKDAEPGVVGHFKLPLQFRPPKKTNGVSSGTVETTPSAPIAAILLICIGAMASGCATLEKRLITSSSLAVSVRQELKTYINDECQDAAKTCAAAGVTDHTKCATLMTCWAKRDSLYKITMSIELALKTALGLVGVGDDASAKQILTEVTAQLLDLYSKLKAYKIITAK